MSAEERFNDDIRAIGEIIQNLRQRNDGSEIYQICKGLLKHEKVRIAAPLSMAILEEAVGRYRRDNYERVQKVGGSDA